MSKRKHLDLPVRPRSAPEGPCGTGQRLCVNVSMRLDFRELAGWPKENVMALMRGVSEVLKAKNGEY